MPDKVLRYFSPIKCFFSSWASDEARDRILNDKVLRFDGLSDDGLSDDDSVEISATEAVPFMDVINAAIAADLASIGSERFLAEYLDYHKAPPVQVIANEIVKSIVPSIEERDGELWGVTTITISKDLEPEVMAFVLEWLSSQYSDGWADNFLQFPIYVQEGGIQVSFWKPTREVFHPYTSEPGGWTHMDIEFELDESSE